MDTAPKVCVGHVGGIPARQCKERLNLEQAGDKCHGQRSARQKSEPKQSVEDYNSVAGARHLCEKVKGVRTLKGFPVNYGTKKVSQ